MSEFSTNFVFTIQQDVQIDGSTQSSPCLRQSKLWIALFETLDFGDRFDLILQFFYSWFDFRSLETSNTKLNPGSHAILSKQSAQ